MAEMLPEQLGLGREIIERYAREWTVEIRDLTPLAHRIHELVGERRIDEAEALLSPERIYPGPPELADRLGM